MEVPTPSNESESRGKEAKAAEFRLDIDEEEHVYGLDFIFEPKLTPSPTGAG